MGQFNFRIPDDLHAQARALAALRGVTIKDMVIELLRSAVDDAAIPSPQLGDRDGGEPST